MRLIDADVLDEVVLDLNTNRNAGITRGEYKIIDSVLFEFPAVDAVPVVRCRDCIYADEYGHCEMQTFWGTRDDYCSRGKRREDGDNDG